MEKQGFLNTFDQKRENSRHASREHEICRLQFEFRDHESAQTAKKIVLEWAEKRTGKKFPAEAWNYEMFEALSAGRNAMVSTIDQEGVSIWGLRHEDPDKEVAGRIWSTEVVIGELAGQIPKMSVRLLAHSGEDFIPVKISVPGFVFQIFQTIGLASDISVLSIVPKRVSTDAHFDDFFDFLQNPERRLPIIVVTTERRSGEPLIIPNNLAKATLGMAHTFVLNEEAAWRLSDKIGRELSVFDGGIRIYMPNFTKSDSLFSHKLLIGKNLQLGFEKGKADSWFRRLAAEFSLERLKLGTTVLSYSRIRSESRKLHAIRLLNSDTSTELQVEALKAQNEALEKEREEIIELSELYDGERLEAIERAKDAEQKLQSAGFRISQLEEGLAAKGIGDVFQIEKPTDWSQISDWCAKQFLGKLTLTSSAIRGLKKPEFESLETVIDALEWLALDCRNARIEGGGNRMNNTKVLDGLTHARCGGDEYQIIHQGTRREVDWHLKNGDGNTRNPKRCLRIYYFWDEQSQEIIVADLPAHRKNENS